MKVSEIRVGMVYHNGKDGLRKVLAIKNVTNPMRDVVAVVQYQLLAAKQEREWDTKTQQWKTLIGTTAVMSLDGFAAWAKASHDDASAMDVMYGLQAKKLKLSPGESAFMASILAEAPDATAGTCITFNHTEGRAVYGLEKKGMVIKLDGQVEVTRLGGAWLKGQAATTKG